MKKLMPRSGFTMIELMLAIVVVSMIMLPIGTMLVSSYREPLIQQELFSNEAGAQIALDTLRQKIQCSVYADLIYGTLPNGVNTGVHFSDGTKIIQSGNSLVYVTNSVSIPLIDDGVNSFSITDTDGNGAFQTTLVVIPASGMQPITYTSTCCCRN